MVRQQLAERDIVDTNVLDSMRTVPRHRFVSQKRQSMAYDDSPLPIGHDQTISQPYVVAAMTQELTPRPDHRILEIGTGCGYQAAILAEIVRHVYTIEFVPELAERSHKTLKDLRYRNITVRSGDGTRGWPEEAPFDGIIVTAAAPRKPTTLMKQLKRGGSMIIPLATDPWGRQFLTRIERTEQGFEEETLFEVRFVPMIGAIEED